MIRPTMWGVVKAYAFFCIFLFVFRDIQGWADVIWFVYLFICKVIKSLDSFSSRCGQ